jgi:hypothetical protein
MSDAGCGHELWDKLLQDYGAVQDRCINSRLLWSKKWNYNKIKTYTEKYTDLCKYNMRGEQQMERDY